MCGSARNGQPAWLTIRGCQPPQQHNQLYFLLLFISCEALKPLSTSPAITRGHLCIAQSERKRDTSLLSISWFYSQSDFPSAKHSWQKSSWKPLDCIKRGKGETFSIGAGMFQILSFPVGKINPRCSEGEETIITGTLTCTTWFTLLHSKFSQNIIRSISWVKTIQCLLVCRFQNFSFL